LVEEDSIAVGKATGPRWEGDLGPAAEDDGEPDAEADSGDDQCRMEHHGRSIGSKGVRV
jgi:hypothetical protein